MCGGTEAAIHRVTLGCFAAARALSTAVAGDDSESRQIAMELVNQTGFDPVDAGSLKESWRQQPSTPAYYCDYDAGRMRKALAAAIKGDAPRKRDQLPEHFAKLGHNPSHDEKVAMNRKLNSAVDEQPR